MGHPEGRAPSGARDGGSGFADVALFTLLTELRVAFVIRVKKSTKICMAGVWRKFNTLRFVGNTRRRALERVLYCAKRPQPLSVTMSRKRDARGRWASGIWWRIGPIPRSKPSQNMRAVPAVK